MKHIKLFEEFINEDEIPLNEDLTSVLLLMQSTALLAATLAKVNSINPGSGMGIMDWWKDWKNDRKVNKILDKLKDDPEILQFLELPDSQQRGKWQKLIITKLTDDEQQYFKRISKDMVKRGKI